MKWFFLLGIITLFYACQNQVEEKFRNEFISANGELSSVELLEPFHIDSIQFSTGKIIYFIRCQVNIRNEQVSISVQYDDDPLNGNATISEYKISASDLLKEFEELVVTMEHGLLKLTARNKGATLHLIGAVI